MTSHDFILHDAPGGAAAEHGPIVTITIDNKRREIYRGHQSVAEIKVVGEVPAAFDLEEVINGKLTLLPDDGSVTIKGGEIFLSHPKSGRSS